jgi:hypothetical protein
MHIARQSPQELLVVDSSRWISLLSATAGVVTGFAALAKHQPKGFFGAGLFVLFAVLADAQTRFTFDAMRRVVHWTGRRFFRSESGTIAFDDIRDITVEASAAGSEGSASYRLAILTDQGTRPMAYGYSGIGDFGKMRQAILAMVRPEVHIELAEPRPLADEASIRSLLRQGRRIDAIHLLRSTEKLSLSEAVLRINAIDAIEANGKTQLGH